VIDMVRRIPLLRDRHSHPLLYAALMDAVDLNQPGETRESAIERIRTASIDGGTRWTIATGWNSGRFPLHKRDFDGLPPVVVLSLSIHGLIVNDNGRVLLRAHDETVADHLDDQDWIERNLRRVLNLFARAGASADRLGAFFDRLRQLGVHSVEEMLLVGEDAVRRGGVGGTDAILGRARDL
jgi:predicted amidohydrolase YtcJ